MAKIINITDRISKDKPTIQIGDKLYPVDNSLENVLKFEELTVEGNKGMLKAIEITLGKEAFVEIGVRKMSVDNFKVLTTALLAAVQNLTFEEAEARFQRQEGQI